MKHLVLFGGGAAHLHLLRTLATEPLPSGHTVTLIAPSPRHVHLPSLPAWVAGERTLDSITVALAPWARKAGAAFVQADLVHLDPAQRVVALSNGQTLQFDALSVNADAGVDRDAVPGARENALFTRPVEHFIQLWDVLLKLSEEQVLSLVVVGGQAHAVELALAVQKRLGRRARVALVTGGGPPLPSQPGAVQRRVKQALKRGQVTLFEDACESVSVRQLQLRQQGLRLGCDAPVLALDPSPPPWVRDSGLALDPAGFVQTGATLQSASHPCIFVAGEIAGQSDATGWRLGADPRTSAALALNLRRFLAGGTLVPREPAAWPAHAIGTTHGAALASMGPFLAETRWVGWLKSRIEQRFVRRYQLEAPPVLGGAAVVAAAMDEDTQAAALGPVDVAAEPSGHQAKEATVSGAGR